MSEMTIDELEEVMKETIKYTDHQEREKVVQAEDKQNIEDYVHELEDQVCALKEEKKFLEQSINTFEKKMQENESVTGKVNIQQEEK